MKLSKEENNGGYVITVTIGGSNFSSYWSAPPKEMMKFDMEYLKNRYSVINTKKRTEEFTALYNNLWVEVTESQLELMSHTLGLDYKKKPYRNYFFTSEEDKEWNELVEKGIAAKSDKRPNEDGNCYFWLTKRGVEFVLGKFISEEKYREI